MTIEQVRVGMRVKAPAWKVVKKRRVFAGYGSGVITALFPSLWAEKKTRWLARIDLDSGRQIEEYVNALRHI